MTTYLNVRRAGEKQDYKQGVVANQKLCLMTQSYKSISNTATLVTEISLILKFPTKMV
jgi:hypothetical protein